jgi:acyl-CoA thioester hydrolase
MTSPPRELEAYPARVVDTIRFADTDRLGHVNNAAFATFCESGRVALLYDPRNPLAPPGTNFVIARLVLDFRAEINYPGTVEIGTLVARIGRSSAALHQALFHNGGCVATSESVIVLMDEATRRSTALPPAAVQALERLIAPAPGAWPNATRAGRD